MCHKPWETTQSFIRVQQSQTRQAEFSTQTLSTLQERDKVKCFSCEKKVTLSKSCHELIRCSSKQQQDPHRLVMSDKDENNRNSDSLCCWAGGVLFRPRSHEITGRMLRVCRPGDLWSQCWFSHSLIMSRRAVQWCSLIVWWITLISVLPADTLHSNKIHYLTSNLNTSRPRWPQKPWQIFTRSMCYRLTQSPGTFPSGKGTGMSGLMFGCCVDLLCRQLETSDSGCLNFVPPWPPHLHYWLD